MKRLLFALLLLIPGTLYAGTSEDLVSCGMPPECAEKIGATALVPSIDSTTDLGTSSISFRTLYVDDIDLSSDANPKIIGGSSNTAWRKADDSASNMILSDGGRLELADGNLLVSGNGNTLVTNTTGGGGACAGTFTCNGTTPVVVSTSCYSTHAMVLFSLKTGGGTPGDINVTATTAGVSFTVTCEAGDTSVNNWMILKHTE